jgi:CheY-like chemotaxis protein
MSKKVHLSTTVLGVDDLDMLRKMVRDFLQSLGSETLEATHAEAIHIARSFPSSIAICLGWK